MSVPFPEWTCVVLFPVTLKVLSYYLQFSNPETLDHACLVITAPPLCPLVTDRLLLLSVYHHAFIR